MKLDAILLRSRVYEAACDSGLGEQDAIVLAHEMSQIVTPLQNLLVLFADERRYGALSKLEVMQAVAGFAEVAQPATGGLLDVLRGKTNLLSASTRKAKKARDAFSLAGQLTEAARGSRP